LRPDIIWSIHDVSPESFAPASELVDRLTAAGRPLSILVVPGGEWRGHQIETLIRWQGQGHVMAAHGWSHRCGTPRTLYHRIHGRLFSRDVAEHLSKSSMEILGIVRRGEQWFGDAGLQPPGLYVPPAWALGDMPLWAFRDTAFRWVETLSGIYDVRADRSHHLPLVGFEADTASRRRLLRLSNRLNWTLGAAARRPVRVAVHPNDLDLLLAADLTRVLESPSRSLGPGDL
jgi:hypothetical protein